MKYDFIGRERSCHPVEKMCLVLRCIKMSGYYAWNKQSHGIRWKANELMLMEIRKSYKIGRGAYWSPRIFAEYWVET